LAILEKTLEKSDLASQNVKTLNTKVAALEQAVVRIEDDTQLQGDVDVLFEKCRVIEQLHTTQTEETTLSRLLLDGIQQKQRDQDRRLEEALNSVEIVKRELEDVNGVAMK